MINLEQDMRSHAVTRRDFLLSASLALASRFTSIAGSYLEWLLRWCLIDTRLRFAA